MAESNRLQLDPNSVENEDFSYVDFMMLGRTGMGKSTIGNKLLGIDPATNKPYKESDAIKQWGYDGDEMYFFETGDGEESVTKKCKVLSNSNVRVMDTRGFADSEMTKKFGVVQGNLQSFRWILQAQRENDLRFTRVLYFYPQRGPPERAEGTIQEEIKVMYGYFGQKIFDIMVIIVTNNRRPAYQRAGFCDEDIEQTKRTFLTAFKHIITQEDEATDTNKLKSPPVVYIPIDENHIEVYKMINGATVIEDDYFAFSPEYPKDPEFRYDPSAIPPEVPSLKYGTSHEEMRKTFQQNKGKRFTFEDRCSRCAIKLVHERLESGEELPVAVIHNNGEQDVYDNSYCHPLFVPEYYSRVKRYAGGVAHIVTLGMGLLYEYFTKNKSWPGFTSMKEVCIKCKRSPGAPSCHPVNQPYEIDGKLEKIDHTRELDIVELLAEESEEGEHGEETQPTQNTENSIN